MISNATFQSAVGMECVMRMCDMDDERFLCKVSAKLDE